MFYRQDLNTDLTQIETILKERDSGGNVQRVAPNEIAFHLDATDPVITLGETEVPANEDTLTAFGDLLQVPTAFLKRLSTSASASTINLVMGDLLASNVRKDLAVELSSTGQTVLDLSDWGSSTGIKPLQVVEKILPVFQGTPAQVARLVDEKHTFAFDAYVPFDAEDFGIGGDFQKDDLTAAGVRIEMDLKHGLVPTVQPYTYRRVCTNGMETPMAGLKVEGRGQSVEEVLAELEGMARLAFAQAEKNIEHFYEMRNQPVENPERIITQMARERGIPTRSTMRILQLAAGEDLPDNPSLFDVVNLVTNFANSPDIRRDGGRTLLERAGGATVTDNAQRCGHCTQKVTG